MFDREFYPGGREAWEAGWFIPWLIKTEDEREPIVNAPEAFREEIQKNLGFAPSKIIADGKKHRFSLDRKNKRNDAGEYRFYDGEFPGGWAKSHRDPNSYFTWNARGVRTLSDADRARYAAEEADRERIEEADRAAAIARVGRRWNAAGPAKHDHPYLTRKGVLAHGIRQSGNTLLVPAIRDGELVNVQRIFPSGKKLFEKDAPMRGAYHAIGKIGDLLIICEGYATGATLFETTGIPVVVAFDAGNLMPVAEKLLELHPGAEIVVAADDDFGTEIRRGFNPGIDAAEKVAELVGTKEMVPPFDREQYRARIVEDEDYKAPSDWNDHASIYGPVAVRDCFFPPSPDGSDPQGRPEPAPASAVDYETMDEAGEITKDVIASFMADAERWNKFEICGQMPVYFFSPDVGIGKSSAAIDSTIDLLLILRGEGNRGVVQFLVPNHKLSHETVDKFYARLRERGLDGKYIVHLHKARTAKIDPFDDDPKASKMCAISEEYEIAATVMGEKEVCNKKCPHRRDNGCPYIEQLTVANIDILVSSHHMLFAPILKQISEEYTPADVGDSTDGVAAVVIDESFLPAISSTNGRRTIAIDAIRAPLKRRKGYDDNNFDHVAFHLDLARSAVVEALKGEREGYVRREAFAKGMDGTSEKFTADMARQAAIDEWKFAIGKKDEEDWRLRGVNRHVITRINMFYAIAALLDEDGPERSGLLKIVKDKDGHRDLQVHKRNFIHEDYMITPKLFIDANLKPELLNAYLGPYWQNFGPIKVEAPFQTIHQAEVRSFSMSSLCPVKELSENDREKLKNDPEKLKQKLEWIKEEQETRRKNRAESRNDILALQKAYGGQVLVVTYKAVRKTKELKFDPALNIHVEHFGSIRGTNKYEKARLVIILGRPLAAPASYEEALGVLTGAAPVKALGDSERPQDRWFSKGRRSRLRRLKDGRVVEEMVTTWVHPNPLVEALMQASCVDEITQAIGRGRGVRREAHEPLDVVVFNDVPLGVPVDYCFSADPPQTSKERMLAAGGFAFERHETMQLAYPPLWKTAEAAKSARRRDSDRKPEPGSVADIIATQAPELVPVRFQRASEGSQIEEAAYDPAQVSGDPEAALKALVGPLAMFEIEGKAAPKLSELAGRILEILATGNNRTNWGHLPKNIYLKGSDPDLCGYSPRPEMRRDDLRRKLHAIAEQFAAAVAELIADEKIVAETVATGKRPALVYRLAEPKPANAA
jgi:putative DNA primase/helicase